MKLEREVKLTHEAALGAEAEEALKFISRVFKTIREEMYRDMEGDNPDMSLIHAKLWAMRKLEDRLNAYAKSGEVAINELKRGEK